MSRADAKADVGASLDHVYGDMEAADGLLGTGLTAANAAITALEARVTALENAEPPPDPPDPPPASAFTSFPVVGACTSNVGANQGVATDGSRFWTTALDDASLTIRRYDAAWAMEQGRSTATDAPAEKTQVNGIVYEGGSLYIGANNWASGRDRGWILEYDPDTLALIAEHDVGQDVTGGKSVEGCAFRNGEAWVFFNDSQYVARYSAGFATFLGAYDVIATPVDAGKIHNGGFWSGGVLYLNHHDNSSVDSVDAFAWDGSAFSHAGRIPQPTDGGTRCAQGMSIHGSLIYWAQRKRGGDGNKHSVVWTGME